MNSKENTEACILMQNHEKIPTFLYDTSFGTSVLGIPASDIHKNGFDAELSAKSVVAGRKFLGHDATIGSVSCGDTSLFGAKIEYYPNRTSMISKPAFSNATDLYNFSSEEYDCASIDKIVKSNALVRELDPDAYLMANIPSPFLMAAVLRGLESLMMDMYIDEKYTADLIKFSEEITEIFAEKTYATFACDSALIPGAYDNVDLIGIEGITKYCLPSLKKLEKLTKKYGLSTVFHPHGILSSESGKEALELFLSLRYECIYFGEDNDFSVLNEYCKNKCSIMGGIDTATTIFMGDEKRIVDDTISVLNSIKNSNFIFSCSCSIDYGLEPKKLKLMMDTLKKWNDKNIH